MEFAVLDAGRATGMSMWFFLNVKLLE
jgi:hypothetical protein